jgi:hypothetical protein
LRVAVAAELALEERAAADEGTGGAAVGRVEPEATATTPETTPKIASAETRLPAVRRPLPMPGSLAAFALPAYDITPAAPQPPRRGLPRRPGAP